MQQSERYPSALAATVIVSHSWPLGGFGADPQIGDRALGRWAVAGFFSISGYLITRSRLREGLGDYLWRRLLRIYPGYVASLLVVAFVLVPASQLFFSAGASTFADSAHFVTENLLLFIRQWTIGDTLQANPIEHWDGSLWTLFYEALCYLAIALLASVASGRALRSLILVGLVATSAVDLAVSLQAIELPEFLRQCAELFPFFFAGATMLVFEEPVSAAWPVAGGAGATVGFVWCTGAPGVIAALPLAYVLLWLGIRFPIALGSRHDFSYGMYVYAFPVQQLLVLAGAPRLTLGVFVPLSIAVTAPFAMVSWFVVERPVRRWRGLFSQPAREASLIGASDSAIPVAQSG